MPPLHRKGQFPKLYNKQCIPKNQAYGHLFQPFQQKSRPRLSAQQDLAEINQAPAFYVLKAVATKYFRVHEQIILNFSLHLF